MRGASTRGWNRGTRRRRSRARAPSTTRRRYLVSGGYLEQEGVVLNSRFTRVSGRLNLDREVSARFRIGTSLSGTRTDQAINGAESTGTGNADTGITAAIQFDPSLPPRDSAGRWNQRVVLNENFVNPLAESSERRSPVYTMALLGSVYAEYDLGNGLQLRTNLGGNFNFLRNPTFSPMTIASGNETGLATQASSERRE